MSLSKEEGPAPPPTSSSSRFWDNMEETDLMDEEEEKIIDLTCGTKEIDLGINKTPIIPSKEDPFLQIYDKAREEMMNKETIEIPTTIISIDPGNTIGYICGQYYSNLNEKKIYLKINKKRIYSKLIIDTQEVKGLNVEDIERKIKSWIFQEFNPRKDFNVTIVLIEKQYIKPPTTPQGLALWFTGIRLNIISTIFYTIFDSTYSTLTKFIHANTYKDLFGIATGNHYKNKLKAVEYAKSLIKNPKDKEFIQNDHIADAFNQMIYYLQSSHDRIFGKYTNNNSDSFSIEVTFEDFED